MIGNNSNVLKIRTFLLPISKKNQKFIILFNKIDIDFATNKPEQNISKINRIMF